jgi:hypothetical protein
MIIIVSDSFADDYVHDKQDDADKRRKDEQIKKKKKKQGETN